MRANSVVSGRLSKSLSERGAVWINSTMAAEMPPGMLASRSRTPAANAARSHSTRQPSGESSGWISVFLSSRLATVCSSGPPGQLAVVSWSPAGEPHLGQREFIGTSLSGFEEKGGAGRTPLCSYFSQRVIHAAMPSLAFFLISPSSSMVVRILTAKATSRHIASIRLKQCSPRVVANSMVSSLLEQPAQDAEDTLLGRAADDAVPLEPDAPLADAHQHEEQDDEESDGVAFRRLRKQVHDELLEKREKKGDVVSDKDGYSSRPPRLCSCCGSCGASCCWLSA